MSFKLAKTKTLIYYQIKNITKYTIFFASCVSVFGNTFSHKNIMPAHRRKTFTILIISFIVSFILLVAAALYALRQINANNAFSAQIDHTNAVISKLYQLDIMVRDLDIMERGYMLTGDSSYLTEIASIQKNIHPSTQALRNLVDDNKQQLELLTQLRATLALRINAIKQNLDHFKRPVRENLPQYFYEGKTLKEQSAQYISRMHHNEYQLLQDRYNQKKSSERIAQSVVQMLIITLFIITIFLFIVLIREIYIRKKFQEELQKRVVDLKQTNEELEQVAFAISHDMQEPLRKIRIFSNKLLYSKGDEEKTMEVATRLNRSAGTAQALLEDMEVLLGLRKDHYEEQVSLTQLLDTLLSEMQEQIRKKNAVVHTDRLPFVNGNYKQLQLLFRNILDNALKFSRKDQPSVINITCRSVTDEDTHSIATNEGSDYYKITVEDNGIGFENMYADRIFKIFQRLHDDEQYSGKGIGLAICQRIMANHGGTIKAYGDTRKGAIFTFYFPKNSA